MEEWGALLREFEQCRGFVQRCYNTMEQRYGSVVAVHSVNIEAVNFKISRKITCFAFTMIF